MRAQVKDVVGKLIEDKIANGSCQVLSDYNNGQRIVLEFYGATPEEEKICHDLVKAEYPSATVYTTSDKDR